MWGFMTNQKRKVAKSAGIAEQIPGKMHIEDFPELLPTNYFVGGGGYGKNGGRIY